MATRKTASKKTASKKAPSRTSRSTRSKDAVALLTADHDKVKKMFKEFEKLHMKGADADSEAVARAICQELTMHTMVEEEIFYPEVRAAMDDQDLMNEAEVEHASAKDLIEQIQASDSSDELYAAKVIVLGEYINHHVEEEQKEMFPKARRAKVDLVALGEQIDQRKAELKTEMGIDDEAAKPAPRKRPMSRQRTRSNGHARA